MTKVLVTGGAGFIGSHLTDKLVELGHEVRVLDDFSSGCRANLEQALDRIELHEADMRDPAACRRACSGVEVIFHEAAVPSVPKSVEQPELSHQVNIDGTFNLLRAAVDCKVRRVIYAASSSAYGDTEVSPKHEGIRPEPLSPYAVQKLMGEHYLRAFSECFGLETLSLRYFNVFGARQNPKSQYAAVIPAFVTAVLRNEPPTIYGDGTQTRDFSYVDNVVRANILALQASEAKGQVVNAACGGQISVNQMLAEINRLLGAKMEARYAERRPGDVMHSCADGRAARALLGYEPIVSFEEGLRRAIEYYKGLV